MSVTSVHNFPDLFGESVVLPELPRNFLASAAYKF